MSNQDDTQPLGDIRLALKIHKGETVTMQTILHGFQPSIVIIPTETEDDPNGFGFDVNATGPDTIEELADMLEGLADCMREAATVYNAKQAAANPAENS